MAVMQSTWYIPEEELRFRNYPEVNTVLAEITSIMSYAQRTNLAIDAYNNGTYDKIDIDMVALQNNILLCRSVCEVLGKATNVCYDLLMELRSVQKELQMLLYIKNKYKDKYIGTPTSTM